MKVASSERHCLEHEVLAAFIDRRLVGDEREDVIEHLADCDDCYELFTETLRFQISEEKKETGGRFETDSAGRRGLSAAGWWRLAAAITLMAVGLFSFQSLRRPKFEVASLVDRLERRASVPELASNLFDGVGWTVMRGGRDYYQFLDFRPANRAFRLGVRTVDLEVALRAGDRERTTVYLAELEGMSGRIDLAGELVSYQYGLIREELETASRDDLLAAAGNAAEDAEQVADADLEDLRYFAFGKWVEAGRLAAAQGDERFFRRRGFRVVPRDFLEEPPPNALREPIDAVDGILADGVEGGELPELRAALDNLMIEGGRL